VPALEGIRVLELPGDAVAYAGRLLYDLGAEVIKVEPAGGEPLRRAGTVASDKDGSGSTSLAFERYHGGKRSVVIDLAEQRGRVELLNLVEGCDAVLECFPPGFLAANGLGFPEFVAHQPRLILASVTPFGQYGPRAHSPGTDIVTLASGHMMHMTGMEDGPPQRLGGEQSLHLPAMYAATGVVFALLGRETHGAQHLDISMQECIPQFTLEAAAPNSWEMLKVLPSRWGRNRNTATPYGMFECLDGWVGLVALTARQWGALAAWLDELGVSSLLDPQFAFDAPGFREGGEGITTILSDFFKLHPKQMLMEQGQQRGVPIMSLSTAADLVESPQLAARGFFQAIDHPSFGPLRYPSSALRFDGLPVAARTAPRLDEGRQVLLSGRIPEPA
jgi:crotonobetainyl-CoA:carnitine CoA-transferase CaiB-like acyl-CoA transferase